jgi:glycosyltransferase involved in cell wall biosynthesis
MPGTLVLAGGNKYNPGYGEYLRGVAAALQNPASVLLPGPVTGDLKQALLQHSVCLLLPSHRESFGNVVLEALAAGTPVLASVGTPWQPLEEAGLGRCLPWDREVWAGAMMAAATKGFPPRKEFAPRSRAWVAKNYSWERSADRYLEVYREVTGHAIA